MKIKTSELIGAKLDLAVAKAAEIPTGVMSGILYRKDLPGDTYGPGPIFKPSTDWSHGGPLLDHFSVEITGVADGSIAANVGSVGVIKYQHGDTILIAAMRAIVAAKLGEEIEVPEELV